MSDDYLSLKAMLFMGSNQKIGCYDHTNTTPKFSCSRLYPTLTITGKYVNWGDVIDLMVTHHNIGKNETNPYTGSGLFTRNSSVKGSVIIGNSNDNSATIKAYSIKGKMIFNASAGAF